MILRSTLLLGLLVGSAAGADFPVTPGDKGDGLAPLVRARDAARAAGAGPHRLVLAAGTYRLRDTFELDQRDDGLAVVAAPGAEVRLCGSVAIPPSALQPVTDAAVVARLSAGTRADVRWVDLRALGIQDVGVIGPHGFSRPYVSASLEIAQDDRLLGLARWPKQGTPGEPIATVIDKGPIPRNGQKPTRGGTFTFTSDVPLTWADPSQVWITGFFANGYADDLIQIKSIDRDKKAITTVHAHMYGFSTGSILRWTALNALESLSEPGECVLDGQAGRVYLIPWTGTGPATRWEATVLDRPLVAIEGATGVTLQGLYLENARHMGVYIERGAKNRIVDCTMRNLGMVAVCIGKGVTADVDYAHGFTGETVSRNLGSWHTHIYNNTTWNREGGTGHQVLRCSIHDIGSGAIMLGGGDRKTLSPGGNAVEHCDIRRFNRWDRTYRAAVNIDGVGNRIANNRIEDAPGSAIYLHGNDHVIELNDIARVMQDGNDMGAFYMGRDPTERGNLIRWNRWTDLARANMTFCIYLDDFGGCGTTITGNIFDRAGNRQTVFLNRSSDVTVRDNLFVGNFPPPIGVLYKGKPRIALFNERLEAVGWDTPLWRERYPGDRPYRGLTASAPWGNVLEPNLKVGDKDGRLKRDADGRVCGFDPAAPSGLKKPPKGEVIPDIPFDRIGPQKP